MVPEPTRVTFHRWFLYVRDVVYAEHGHRFHDINAVPVPGGREVPGVYTPADVPLAAYLEAFGSAVRARGSARMLAKDLGTLTGALLARIARERSHSMAPTAPGESPTSALLRAPASTTMRSSRSMPCPRTSERRPLSGS